MIGMFPLDDDMLVRSKVAEAGSVEKLPHGWITQTYEKLRFHPGNTLVVTGPHTAPPSKELRAKTDKV